MLLRTMTLMLLFGGLTLAACEEEEDKASEEGDDDDDDDNASDFDCENYCRQADQDIQDAACGNDPVFSEDDIQDCADACEFQAAIPTCGELFEIFWQCTLDEYPGNFTCGPDGTVEQPTQCSDEQQAVLDCM